MEVREVKWTHRLLSWRKDMLKHIVMASAALALFCSDALADVKIRNGSKYEIDAVYVSPSSIKKWGEDHLGKKVLAPGDVLTLTGVEAGKWDFRIEFNKPGKDKKFVCEIADVELDEKGDDSEFDNKTLSNCAKATEAAHADEESDDE